MSKETTIKTWWDIRALEGTKASKLRQNAMLLRGAPSLFWPLGRDTNSKLWPYAIACLEAALKLSDIAIASYAEIVEAWELPGCHDIKNVCLKRWPDTRAWLDKMKKAYANKGDCPELQGVASTFENYEHNTDFNTLNLVATQFVLLSFNRQQDVLDEVYKVIPGLQSFHLTKAIAVRSIIDHTEYEAARLRQYQHPDIDRIMTGPWPKYRTPEREIRSQITNTFSSEGLNLKHDDNLLKAAEQWYKCRVNPGSIEQYIHDESERINQQAHQLSNQDLELYYLKTKTNKRIDHIPDQSRISNDIAVCDEVTGYPRQWRK